MAFLGGPSRLFFPFRFKFPVYTQLYKSRWEIWATLPLLKNKLIVLVLRFVKIIKMHLPKVLNKSLPTRGQDYPLSKVSSTLKGRTGKSLSRNFSFLSRNWNMSDHYSHCKSAFILKSAFIWLWKGRAWNVRKQFHWGNALSLPCTNMNCISLISVYRLSLPLSCFLWNIPCHSFC